jgi:hypothetical protein
MKVEFFIIKLQRNPICLVSFRTSHRRYHPKTVSPLLSFNKGPAKDLACVHDLKLQFVHLLSRSRGGLYTAVFVTEHSRPFRF